jgi:hypothetical protein
MTIVGLKNTDSLDKWRQAKDLVDEENDVAEILGCVGQPLTKFLAEHVLDRLGPEAKAELVKAARDARERLREYCEGYAQGEVDCALGEVWNYAHNYIVEIDSDEVQVSDTMEDIAQRGADDLATSISNWEYTVVLEDEEL